MGGNKALYLYWLLVLLLLGQLSRPATVRADEPAKAQAGSERDRLEAEADDLFVRSLLLSVDHQYGKASELVEKALEKYRQVYPPALYPNGHRKLAEILHHLGLLNCGNRQFGKAAAHYRECAEMEEKLSPDGDPTLAKDLSILGLILNNRGEYGEAEPVLRDALALKRRLYPADKYPDGHPELARSLNNLGLLLKARGEYDKAVETLGQGIAIYDRQVAIFADAAAEAEVLNFYAALPGTRNLYLAAAARAESSTPPDQYSLLWSGKSALARVQQQRRRLLRLAAAARGDVQAKLQELIGVRQDLARVMLAPAATDRDLLLKDLTDRKEHLESDLARVLPACERQAPPYTDLASRIPDHTAFIDLYRYADLDTKSQKWDSGHYAAFLLLKGRPVRRLELDGTALAIEKDVKEWRKDINNGFRSEAAGRLRASVWVPIAKELPEDVKTVYICPDADLSAQPDVTVALPDFVVEAHKGVVRVCLSPDPDLSALPWAALPGAGAGRVLLEDYTIAVVPSGPFLLEQLTRKADPNRDAGVLLTVGGVRYDRDGAPADKAGKPWPNLPATAGERAAVALEAGKLAKPPAVVERSGADANVTQLVKDLPTARWAHLATHGFFAAPDSTEREHLFRPDDFLMGVGRERRGAAARNPLTLSGLVLAGANQPTDDDSGVLTGEAVAGLDLDGMDLAVLSACQTGLGEAAAGEGVFGLQRAFHIAGARNVVASLWTVDDDATAALMNLFYVHLWEKGEPPLEALHQAQLELYRNPASIPKLAQGHRGGDFEETVRLVTKPPADPKAPATRPAAVKDWAAFALSGAGR